MVAPTLEDYQFWYGIGEEGILFGDGTDIDVPQLEGLESLDVRSGTRELPRDDGSVPGLHLVNSRQPVFDLEIIGDSLYYDFLDVIGPSRIIEGELHWKFPGREQVFMRGRPLARSGKRDAFMVGRIPVTIAFECADPRVYGVNLEQVLMGIYNPSFGGLDFEVDFEVDFTGSGGGGETTAVNDGDAPAYPIIRFFGPISGTCTSVKIENVTTGISLENTADITTGQVLKADMDARKRGTGSRIMDLAGSSVYGSWTLPRETFYLAPGENVLRLTITGSSTDVQAIINWRDTSY